MEQQPEKQYSRFVALSFIVISLVFGACQSGAIRYMTKQMDIIEALFLSNIATFAVVFTLNLVTSKQKLIVPVQNKKLMLFRCIVGAITMFFYVLSLKYLSLLIFSAFALIPNLVVALIGIIYFKEPVSRTAIIGLAVGAVAVLSLSYSALKFIQADQIVYLFLPCGFVFFMSCVVLSVRGLVKTEPVTSITYYYSIGLLVSAVLLFPFIDQWHSINQTDIMIAIGVTGSCLMILQNFRNLALKYNTLTIYAAMMPLSLITSSFLDYIMYGGIPAQRTILASILVLISSFLVARGKEKIQSQLK